MNRECRFSSHSFVNKTEQTLGVCFMSAKQKITPFLWFDGNAEEAVNFYTSIFKDGKIVHIERYPEHFEQMRGKVLTAMFELNGQELMAIDGGPQYKFTE